MKRSRWVLLTGGAIVALVVAACVGEDPGGNNQADSPEGGSRNDSGADGDDGGNDPGNDGGADGATPFDVRAVPGLRAFWESTQRLTKESVGTSLVSWADISGRWDAGGASPAPDGGAHLVQQDPMPIGGGAVASVQTNSTAGRPALETSNPGFRATITNHPDFEVGKGDFAIITVAKVASGTGPFWYLMVQSTNPRGIAFSASGVCWELGNPLGPKCTDPSYSADTNAHVFVARRKGVQLLFRVDGTTRGSRDVTVEDPDLTVFDFAAPRVLMGGNTAMQMSELVYQVGPLPDAKLEELEAHLKQKYALP